MTQTLESLVRPEIDLAPALAEYRHALFDAVEAGLSPDDPGCAAKIAGLARELALSAPDIRRDHQAVVKMHRLEQRFDAAELNRLKRELEPLRLAEQRFTVAGGQMDEELRVLRRQRGAATSDDLPKVLAAMEAVEERGRSFGRARRGVEDLVITMLNARDRLAAFRRGNRRLFPEADD